MVSLSPKLPCNTSFIMFTVWMILLVMASLVSFAAFCCVFYLDIGGVISDPEEFTLLIFVVIAESYLFISLTSFSISATLLGGV